MELIIKTLDTLHYDRKDMMELSFRLVLKHNSNASSKSVSVLVSGGFDMVGFNAAAAEVNILDLDLDLDIYVAGANQWL